MPKNSRVLALFDVDGTLTEPRKLVSPETVAFLAALREKIAIGVVGGSDLLKQKEQLGDSPAMFDWCFAENGLWAAKDGAVIGETSFKDHLGEEKLKKLINWILRYFADLDIPVKRGTFIEFRQGMLNVSPIGRNCSREERNDFEKFDLEHKVGPRRPPCTLRPAALRARSEPAALRARATPRLAQVRETMVAKLKQEFADYKLTYSIGGQISFDLFPQGWDKTYCLRYLPEADFDGAAPAPAATPPPPRPRRRCPPPAVPAAQPSTGRQPHAQRSTFLATRPSWAATTTRSSSTRARSATPSQTLTHSPPSRSSASSLASIAPPPCRRPARTEAVPRRTTPHVLARTHGPRRCTGGA